jgi:signal transduction histidine kinase
MRSQHTTRRLPLKWLVIPLILWAPVLPVSQGANRPPKNVLILSEVGSSNPAVATIIRELVSELTAKHDFQINLYLESFETPAFENAVSELKVEQDLNAKYEHRNIDIIVALGPTPIVFMSHFADSFLPGVPVLFCGSSQEQTGFVKPGSRFTGSWLQLEPGKTIDAALKLLPATNQVIVVGGSSGFDQTNEDAVRTALRSYPTNIDFAYWTGLAMPELLARLRQAPDGSVVLYVSIFADASGNRFVNAVTSLPLVTEASRVPVFVMSDSLIGRGALGGYVLDYVQQGKSAAENALELLHGKSPNEIPIRLIPGSYEFDARQLHRWRLSERDLPAGSILLYQDRSLWEHIKWTVAAYVLSVLVLGLVVAYLLYNRRQLRSARDEQLRLSGMVINAHEEERKRIASELHDDFSQRLALLSVGMEGAAELVPSSPAEAMQQLHELVSSAGELSGDLHTLSHRLHSSTLERLGLVAGIAALCSEAGSQQGICVDFSSNCERLSVLPAVALCFFRVVQEGLRNVKKHSGASTARVQLELADGQLRLSISDQGAGFDMKGLLQKEGIGIFSMEERARYIGAHFGIHSAPQQGTRIDLWKRLDQNGPGPEDVPATSEFVTTWKTREEFRCTSADREFS